ncbi:MAG: MaoC family dehydratase [Pseudomonadota bacterium]
MNVSVGDLVPPWEMPSVSAARMRTMAAILRDPNPVHWDSRVVDKLGYGKHTINQGPLGLSYMVNMLHAWTGVGSITRVYMTFPRVVLDGDHITARGKVTAVREEDGVRYADCDIWLDRPGTDNPLEGRATVRLPGAGESA